MKIEWHIAESDVERVRSIVETYSTDAFVKDRISKNLATDKPTIDGEQFWRRLVICLLTTQQRVGPKSKFHQFLKSNPLLLSLDFCRDKGDGLEEFSEKLLSSNGLRLNKRIADEIVTNLRILDSGLLEPTVQLLDCLRDNQSAEYEREAARYISNGFKGVGPKQSRNLLQALGLTRYEIPLDSRLIKWINVGLNVKLSTKSLSDEGLYCLVEDGFIELCRKAEELPCIVDACIFVSYDKGGWSDDDLIPGL